MEFGECIDEAAEQAGLDPAALTHRHLNSISRSFGLVMIDIENEGARPEYRMETSSFTINAGQGGLVLPGDTIDVTDVVITVDGTDHPLARTHRQDYLSLSDKSTQGRPTMYWVSKTLNDEINFPAPDVNKWGKGPIQTGMWGDIAKPGSAITNPKVLVLWPINNTNAVTVTVNRLRYAGQPTNLSTEVDARRNWLNVIITGLAARIALKYNVQRYTRLDESFHAQLRSRVQSEDRGPVHIGFRGHGFSRRRRH